jgi:small subunit ribosomal protein S5
MEPEKNTQNNNSQPIPATVAQDTPFADAAAAAGGERRRNERTPRGGDRKPRREPRAKPEFDQKIIDIRRVTRVSSGGRRFSFSVALVAGNRKGKVGVGIGKAGDTSLAIDKALKNAKKNMIDVVLNKHMSIAHEVSAKFNASYVEIMPARGRGVSAGSSVRDVIELAGIKEVGAKLRSGTKNKLNNARVAIKALSLLKK